MGKQRRGSGIRQYKEVKYMTWDIEYFNRGRWNDRVGLFFYIIGGCQRRRGFRRKGNMPDEVIMHK